MRPSELVAEAKYKSDRHPKPEILVPGVDTHMEVGPEVQAPITDKQVDLETQTQASSDGQKVQIDGKVGNELQASRDGQKVRTEREVGGESQASGNGQREGINKKVNTDIQTPKVVKQVKSEIQTLNDSTESVPQCAENSVTQN